MQKTGASKADIANVLRDDTDSPPRTSETFKQEDVSPDSQPVTADAQTGDGVLDDGAIAQSYVQQAEMFEKQAKELREQAVALDPSLGPKKRTAKKPATKKET